MANSPKSSSSNHENGVGATSNSSISPSPLSPKPVSNPAITKQPHPTINEALSINGGESVNGVGQLGLNQRVNELRTRSMVTTARRVCDHGRADSLSLRNDHSAWLGGEILGAPSSTRGRPLFTPIDFGDNKDFVRSQLLHPPLNVNGVIFTSCKNHDDKNAREKMKKYAPHALSSSSSSSSSSPPPPPPKECGGDCTMTAAAEEMLRTQLLHASSIRDRLMSNRRYDGFNFEDPILRNRSLSIPKSRMDRNSFTNTHHFHNIFNYPTFLSGDTTTPTHSSSQTQPSHKRLIITDLDVDKPTNNARGKKTLAPSPFRLRIHKPTETSGPSIENCLQEIDLGGIMNEPKRKNHSGPNRVVIDLDDSDDGDNENYDGRIHSLPYKRNGPYTCPKCKGMYPTSQHFAAHVTASHYKYETKAQRMKRQMAKIRRRTLKLQQVKDGLTIVPVSSEEAAGPGAGTCSADRFANGGGEPALKVKIEGDIQGHEPDAPPGFGVAKIKMEPYA